MRCNGLCAKFGQSNEVGTLDKADLAWDGAAQRVRLRRVVAILDQHGWPGRERLQVWAQALGQGRPSDQWDGDTLHRALVILGTWARTVTVVPPAERDAWWTVWATGSWDVLWTTQALAAWLALVSPRHSVRR